MFVRVKTAIKQLNKLTSAFQRSFCKFLGWYTAINPLPKTRKPLETKEPTGTSHKMM